MSIRSIATVALMMVYPYVVACSGDSTAFVGSEAKLPAVTADTALAPTDHERAGVVWLQRDGAERSALAGKAFEGEDPSSAASAPIRILERAIHQPFDGISAGSDLGVIRAGH
jgi:hypothetical protein